MLRSVQSVTALSLLLSLPPCQVLASPTLPLIPFSLTPQVVEQSLRKSQQPRASQIKREIRARRNFCRHGFHPLKRSLAKPHGVVKPCLPSTGETWGSQQEPLCRCELCFALWVQIWPCSCCISPGPDCPDFLRAGIWQGLAADTQCGVAAGSRRICAAPRGAKGSSCSSQLLGEPLGEAQVEWSRCIPLAELFVTLGEWWP